MAVATPLTWLLLCLAVQGLGAQESVCEYIKAEYRTSRQVARLEGHINTDMERLTKDVAALADAITRIEHTTTELTTRMSAQAEETEKLKAMLGNLKNNTEDNFGRPMYRGTCQDYYNDGHKTSGVYRLQLEVGQGPMDVYCDMSHGAGWVVFQRRQDGSVNFYRNWTSYEDGFGNFHGEFWLGNRNIHRLTSAGLTQLRVDLQAWNGSTAFALYSHFSVGNASSSYRLSVSGFSGNAGDSLWRNNGQKFSTFDQDHDTWSGNCAQSWKGAWWYMACTWVNLNAEYGSRDSIGGQYIYWYTWLGDQSLQRTELKLK